jgi:MFS family permease
VLAIAFIAALFIAIRWNFYNVPFDRDEGEYAYCAWLMHRGITPYEHSFMQKPPLIIYIYYLAQVIAPSSLWAPRALASLFLAGTIVLIGLIAFRERGKRAGIIAASIMTAMFSFPFLMVNSANTEEFMLLLLIALLALYTFRKEDPKWWHWVVAGGLLAASILFKPIGIFVGLFVIIHWLWERYAKKKRLQDIASPLIMVLLGFVIITLLSFLYFFIKGGIKDFWESAVIFNLYYANEQGYGFSAMVPHFKLFFANWWIVILALVYYAVIRPKRFWFYVGLLFFALAGIYQSSVGHYYILILPFLALITAFSVDEISSKLKSSSDRILFAALITVSIIYVIIFPIQFQYTMTGEDLSLWIYGKDNPFTESRVVADEISRLTTPNDLVYIAGSEPQILWYANRFSPTRFVISYPHSMNTAKAGEYQKEVISNLGDREPKVIVLSQRQSSGFAGRNSPTLLFNYLMAMLASDYDLAGGYVWYDGSSGAYVEEFKENDIGKASLLLFVRK